MLQKLEMYADIVVSNVSALSDRVSCSAQEQDLQLTLQDIQSAIHDSRLCPFQTVLL